MKYLSVCSGIEAASQAWHDLGWQPIAFSEIERFPCQVLARHYPDVPNLGDMTRFKEWPDELLAQAEILVGGPPCQAFSVAGMRESLDDARGNLSLTYVHLLNHIDEKRNLDGRPPAVCLWENVPGVLSTHDNAFGCLLGGLAGSDGALEPPDPEWGWTNAGYVRGPRRAVAWRVLDAQYFGLAQRRRRVFVVASARGLPFCPAKVLFEPESLRGNPSEGREAGRGVAGTVSARTKGGGGLGTDFDLGGGLVTRTLKGEGFDASEDGMGRGIPLVCGTLSDGAHNGGA